MYKLFLSKIKYLSSIIFLLFNNTITFSQVVEKEKELRAVAIDSSIIGWKTGGLINMTFSQVSLTNWAAGGENSVSANGLFNIFAKYNKKRYSFENTLDLGYGFLKQAKLTSRKTDDKIDFSSKFGYLIKNKSYFASLVNFKTQFMPGYNYPNDSVKISNFLSPAYLIFATGYDFKKKNIFSCFIAPLTGKVTFINDQNLANSGAFGVEPALYDELGNILKKGKRSRYEIGGFIKTIFNWEFMKNGVLNSKIELFTNYFNKPQNIDIYWENIIGIKINKLFAISINTVVIYDDDVLIVVKDKAGNVTGKGPRVQFKEVIGIGFSYKF